MSTFIAMPYKMHDAYQENSGDIPEKSKAYDDDGDGRGLESEAPALMPKKINSNRLMERLHNFDARTDNMEGKWYMTFADVRKGSFLPRSGPKSVSETPKKRGRPRKDRASWQHFNRSSIIFLHWIGEQMHLDGMHWHTNTTAASPSIL